MKPADRRTVAPPFFPTREWPLATLSVRVGEIAVRLGTKVEEFDESGMGLVVVTGARFDSYPVSFSEHVLRLDLGTTVSVDAADFAAVGVDAWVALILARLALPPSAVLWRQQVLPPDD